MILQKNKYGVTGYEYLNNDNKRKVSEYITKNNIQVEKPVYTNRKW